jgi:hypothetical protein
MTVRGVVSAQGNDLSDLFNQAAADNGLPARVLVAVAIAESGLSETAERHGTWPDWSVGLFQQIPLYASVGDHSASLENLARCRAYYFDPAKAIPDAARGLGAYWLQTGSYEETAARWNGGPSATWASIPPRNRANYQAAWEQAAQYIGSEEDPVSEHSYQFGFADLANQLGADVVGEPVTDEYQDSGGVTRQITSKGEMVYASGGQPLFLPAVAP